MTSIKNPTTPHLDAAQLRDVQDALRQPLTGRRVLIPLASSKAFVVGTLAPTRNEKDEEMIQLRSANTGELQTMTRQDAIAHMQTERQALTRPSQSSLSSSSNLKAKPPPTQSSVKDTTNTSNTTTTTTPTTAAAVAPNYFEIREELDEQGKEVSAEAVNITNHLKLWENEMRKQGGAAQERPVPTEGGLSASLQSTDMDIVDKTEPAPTPAKVSDEEFVALSARLDELARLEQEEETQKEDNRKSAKQLRSKGWAKGFLNRQTSPKKPKAAAPQAKRAEPSRVPPSNATSPVNHMETQAPNSNDTGRAVGFMETDQVREIPRIGQRSVGEIRKPSAVKQPMLQSSVVSEVVQERPRKGRPKGTDSPESNKDPPPRKPSRFAQQRMGRGYPG